MVSVIFLLLASLRLTFSTYKYHYRPHTKYNYRPNYQPHPKYNYRTNRPNRFYPPVCYIGSQKQSAIVILQGSVSGEIKLNQLSGGRCTMITGHVHGLKPNGIHGFHIHEFGNLSDGCKAAGGHYNPLFRSHAGPRAHYRHVGDLGNIKANETGTAEVYMCDKHVKLRYYPSVIGRSIVVHAGEDDLGLTSHPASKKTGNAGGRLGCGVIAWTKP